ncbi:MAG: hypothetical protein ACE5GD_04510 [Candidatus Geothermarchaeales archaeon]
MPKKTLSERSITLSEVLESLEEEEKKRELSLFQKRTLEYIRKFSKIKGEESRKIMRKLLDLGDITEEEAVQIVNLMPKSREELKTIFYHRKTIIMTDFLDRVLQVLREVRPQKTE